MGHTIVCTPEFEPAGFYEPIDTTNAFSVCLSYEYNVDTDQAAAEKGFQDFLALAADARFFAYRLTGDELILDKSVGNSGEFISVPTTHKWGDDVHAWLKRRSGGQWISAGLPKEALDYNNLQAPHLLLTANTWDAPLPQEANLVFILKATGLLKTDDLVIVPYFGALQNEDPIPVGKELTRDGMFLRLTLTYQPTDKFVPVVGKTRAVGERSIDPTALLDEATGFLKVRANSTSIHALLKRIQERSASLFSPSSQVIGLDWNGHGTAIEDLKRAIWVGMTGLVTLLDPMVIALTMADPAREGPFVTALNAILIDELTGANTQVVTEGITNLVFSRIRTADKPQRTQFAEFIATTFGLGSIPDLSKLDEETHFLPVILRLFADFEPGTVGTADFNLAKATKRFGNGCDAQVLIELSAVAQRLQSEDGFETCVLEAIDYLEVTANRLAIWLGTGDVETCELVLTTFRRFVSESFNGIDASRNASSAVYLSAFLKDVRETAKSENRNWEYEDLEAAVLESNWFARRLGLIPDGPLDPLALQLPTISLDYLDAEQIALLGKAMDAAWSTIVDELLQRGQAVRFLPDHAPGPLPIQIAVDEDTSDVDDFTARYNGIGLLVRRKAEQWAHANLAKLTISATGEEVGPLAIHPSQPLPIDGQRRLFLDYEGVPTASDALSETLSPDVEAGPPQDRFFKFADPTKDELLASSFALLPPLAYGTTYETAAYIVSKGGALPRKIRQSEDEPWLPKHDPEAADQTADGVSFTQTHVYKRTTAIGRVMFVEEAIPGRSARIGATGGIQPLSLDYPRFGVYAAASTEAARDVFRNSDGSGAITLPADDERVSVAISDVWWWTNPGTLTILVMQDPTQNPGTR